jgi:hypothetical protein
MAVLLRQPVRGNGRWGHLRPYAASSAPAAERRLRMLFAGGSRIRTIGPALRDRALNRCIHLISHRRKSRPVLVPRHEPHGSLIILDSAIGTKPRRGTRSLSPASSSEESCELRYGRRRPACDPYAPYGRCRKLSVSVSVSAQGCHPCLSYVPLARRTSLLGIHPETRPEHKSCPLRRAAVGTESSQTLRWREPDLRSPCQGAASKQLKQNITEDCA